MRYKYRRYFLYYLGRVFAFLVYLLPVSIGTGIAALLGRCAYLILPKYRNIAITNLQIAFDHEKSPREIRKIALEVFANLARSACEVISFPKINEKNIDRFVSIDG